MVSKKIITRDCLRIYESKKKKLYDLLEKLKSRNFKSIILIAYFVDEVWKFQKVLNFAKVESLENA